MKKIFFSLIATAILGNLSFCQIKPSEYGFYHNESILLYSKAYMDKETDLTKVSINSIVEGMNTQLKEKYPDIFKDVNLEDIKNYYKDYPIVSSYSFIENWNKNKESYLSKGYLTELTYNFIDDAVKNNLDYNALSLKIKEIRETNDLSDKDKLAFDVAESVLISSNELWNSNNQVAVMARNHCNGRLITADVGTALMFAPAPYLSLFAGGISSLITAYSGDCDR